MHHKQKKRNFIAIPIRITITQNNVLSEMNYFISPLLYFEFYANKICHRNLYPQVLEELLIITCLNIVFETGQVFA